MSDVIGAPGWRPTAVHAAAEVFPMMANDELTALAADIRDNGLLSPIVIDATGQLIDGRNRLAACEIAKIEPTWQQLNGHDAEAFIVSTNLARRNLSKGQQAIALAMIYPDAERGGRGKKTVLNLDGFSKQRLSDARAILRYSQTLARQVRDNATPFDEALREVKTAEQKGLSAEYRLAELQRLAPDVAALVADERISLEAGHAELSERRRMAGDALEAARRSIAALMLTPTHVTIVRTGLLLSDNDLAMLGLTRKAADLFADIEDADRRAVSVAATAFATMTAED